MADINFAREAPTSPIDGTLERIGDMSGALEKPIRCRVQPDLYDWDKTDYTAWHGLIWTVNCEDVEEGRRLREGLAAFFQVFGGSPQAQRELLGVLKRLANQRGSRR